MGLDEGLRQSMCSEQGAGSRTELQVISTSQEQRGQRKKVQQRKVSGDTNVVEGGPTEQSDRMRLRVPVK